MDLTAIVITVICIVIVFGFICALQVWTRRVKRLQEHSSNRNARTSATEDNDAWIFTIDHVPRRHLIDYNDDGNFNQRTPHTTTCKPTKEDLDTGLPSYEEAIAAQKEFDERLKASSGVRLSITL